MANLIRHKRGTGNPVAGDFSETAELLVNTSDGGLFTKTDGGTVVEIGGGGTVSNDGRYIRITGTGTQSISSTFAAVNLGVTSVTSGTNDYTVSAGEITVKNAGQYYVSYGVSSAQTSGNNRQVTQCRVMVNGTEVAGGRSYDYSRITTIEETTNVGGVVVDLSVDDVVKVEINIIGVLTVVTSVFLDQSCINIFNISGGGGGGGSVGVDPVMAGMIF